MCMCMHAHYGYIQWIMLSMLVYCRKISGVNDGRLFVDKRVVLEDLAGL